MLVALVGLAACASASAGSRAAECAAGSRVRAVAASAHAGSVGRRGLLAIAAAVSITPPPAHAARGAAELDAE